MSLEQDTNGIDALSDVADNSGLAEMQQAIEEIEKLKSQEDTESEEKEESEEGDSDEKITPEEIEEEPIKKEKKGDKYRKLQNDKYRALAEKEEALLKVAHLEQMLNESLNSGTYHYGKNAYSELDRAKDSKKRAIEAGDVDALIEADITLTRALNAVSELEKWANDASRKEPAVQHSPTPSVHSEIQQEIATDWLDNHNYLQPSSRNYDSKLAGQVAEFVNYLDKSLAKNNQMDAYFSEDYFNTIENYISDIKNESQKDTKKPINGGYVAGVRNSYNTGGSTKSASGNQITLSADEKRMCANAGISEKEWIKYKLEDLKTGKRA